jgi:hypothetical protein
MEPKNLFQGMNSASLCSLAGRYDDSIPPRFLAPIDSLKIPAPEKGKDGRKREMEEENKNLVPLAHNFNQKMFSIKSRFCRDRSLTSVDSG